MSLLRRILAITIGAASGPAVFAAFASCSVRVARCGSVARRHVNHHKAGRARARASTCAARLRRQIARRLRLLLLLLVLLLLLLLL